MHTQAESDRRNRRHPASALSAATGLLLYFATFLGEATLGAGARWLLAWPLAVIAGAIVPIGLSAGQLASLAALAPLLWSAMALALPGRGWLWARRLGARRPNAEEQLAVNDARAMLSALEPSLPEPRAYVLDDPLPAAATRGGALLLSRGLLECDAAPAVYAHELGHLRSLDARLTGPLWSAHWRAREYAADAHAAALGQAEDLVGYLADHELPFDPPQRRFLLNRAEHPPVAYRIERLSQASAP